MSQYNTTDLTNNPSCLSTSSNSSPTYTQINGTQLSTTTANTTTNNNNQVNSVSAEESSDTEGTSENCGKPPVIYAWMKKVHVNNAGKLVVKYLLVIEI